MGGYAFQLAKTFDQVTGIDIDSASINAAKALKVQPLPMIVNFISFLRVNMPMRIAYVARNGVARLGHVDSVLK